MLYIIFIAFVVVVHRVNHLSLNYYSIKAQGCQFICEGHIDVSAHEFALQTPYTNEKVQVFQLGLLSSPNNFEPL